MPDQETSRRPDVPYTLLVADDSVTIQRVIELTFAGEDIRVVAVSDGRAAIAILDKTPPDIVLADVGMPDQNGYEVARHIKDTARLNHIPIVLLTGAFEPIDQAKVAEVGCDGILAKPFEPQLVIARVKELLARPKGTKTKMPEVIEPWVRLPEDGPPPDTSHGAAVADIENYLDRLDAALSKQQGRSHLQKASAPEPRPAAPTRPPSPSRTDPPPADVPQSHSLSAPPSPVFPPLADAFAALLAAEQSLPAPTTKPAWPVMVAAVTEASPASTAIPDDIVEQVTRRVLDRLSDRVVRETVTEIVLATAERLVKEEIEKIRRQTE